MGHSYRYPTKGKCPKCKGRLYYSNLEDTNKLVCRNCNIVIIPKEKIIAKGYIV